FNQFDVFPGFQGNVPETSWFPIVCEIKNDGPTFIATVEVSSDGFGESQVRRMRVELPTGTLKRVSIPVFSTRYQRGYVVRLLDEGNHVRDAKEVSISSGTLRPLEAGTVLMGALSRVGATPPVFRQITSPNSSLQPVVARFLDPGIVPDNP